MLTPHKRCEIAAVLGRARVNRPQRSHDRLQYDDTQAPAPRSERRKITAIPVVRAQIAHDDRMTALQQSRFERCEKLKRLNKKNDKCMTVYE